MAGKGGFFKSLGDFLAHPIQAVERLIGGEQEPPPAVERPEPVAPVPAYEPAERSYMPPDLVEPVPGVDIGPFTKSETFEHTVSDVGADGDPFAEQLIWDGWFRDDNSPNDRAEARAMFFDYFGIEDYDFPWDEWREWYDSAAA